MVANECPHHLFALDIVHVDNPNPVVQKEVFRSFEILIFANDHRGDFEEEGGACAHHAGTQGTHEHQFIPVSAAARVADAHNFGVGCGIAFLYPLVVAACNDSAVSVGEDGADRQSSLEKALFRFADRFCQQHLFVHGIES
jgi:hypothetical protein